ncbi:MAG: AIR synthase-related protein [Candidatus Staskawiczbacteria bacterium]|nr:AIR synthase-related protein [Candidatus Staskawiczbacteria bacterium]
MTYDGVGVDYDAMDPFKRMAQLAGRETAGELSRHGFSEVEWSRGESCYLVETPFGYIGFVVEGLGTKSLVADALLELAIKMKSFNGTTYYNKVAQCNAAMAFNDIITLGVRPFAYGQYLAVGESSWFDNEVRCRELVEGTKFACKLARCSWGGGETPTLKGIVVPGTADLAGATVGFARKDQLINPANIRPGDAIIFVESSGIHANGLTLARRIADKLPEGYLTKLSDGRTYGETLLDPTEIYVGLVADCQDNGVDIHYAVNITGHGWRKLMRATQPFTYVIETLPKQLPIFDFIQEHGPVDDREAYGNLNMGAGFALYVPADDVAKVLAIANVNMSADFDSVFLAGYIEQSDTKKVVIRPKGLEYLGSTLGVR